MPGPTRAWMDRASERKRKRALRLAKHETKAERILWAELRKLTPRWHKQVPMVGYIVDFYCPAARLVVELDGPSHSGREAYDAMRTRSLAQSAGMTVIRFQNREALFMLPSVLDRIKAAAFANAADDYYIERFDSRDDRAVP